MSIAMFKPILPANSSLSWLGIMARYLIWTSLLNLFWEVLQLPLYTIWTKCPRYGELVYLRLRNGSLFQHFPSGGYTPQGKT